MIYGLLLKGFSEHYLLRALAAGRAMGIDGQLVGLTTRPVRGCGKMLVVPDSVIGEIDLEFTRPILVIPDSADKLVLQTDARLHRIIRTCVERGRVITTSSGAGVLTRVGLEGVQVWRGDSAEFPLPFASREIAT